MRELRSARKYESKLPWGSDLAVIVCFCPGGRTLRERRSERFCVVRGGIGWHHCADKRPYFTSPAHAHTQTIRYVIAGGDIE